MGSATTAGRRCWCTSCHSAGGLAQADCPSRARPSPGRAEVHGRGGGGRHDPHSRGPRRLGGGRHDVRAGFDRATGTLTARDTGTTTLTANLRGFEPVVWHLQVVPGLLGLDRTRVGLRLGERTTLAARAARTTTGKTIGPATVEWSSDRPDVATVSQRRGVAVVSPGHAIVTAAAPWGKTVTADVFVTADLFVTSSRSGSLGHLPDSGRGPRHPGSRPVGRRRPTSRRSARPTGPGSRTARPRRAAPTSTWSTPTAGTRVGSRPIPARERAGLDAGRYPAGVHHHAAGRRPAARERAGGRHRHRALTHDRRPAGTAPADVSPTGAASRSSRTRDGNPQIYTRWTAEQDARRLTKTGDRETRPAIPPERRPALRGGEGREQGSDDAAGRGQHRGAASVRRDRPAGRGARRVARWRSASPTSRASSAKPGRASRSCRC